MKKILSVFAVVICSTIGLGAVVEETACTPQQRHAVFPIAFDVASCVMENIEHADEDILKECVKENVSKEDVLKLISTGRKAVARASAKAGCGAGK